MLAYAADVECHSLRPEGLAVCASGFWRAGAKATYPAVLESHQPDNWKRQAGFRLLFLPLAFSVRMTDKTIRWGVDLPRLRGVRKARTRAD